MLPGRMYHVYACVGVDVWSPGPGSELINACCSAKTGPGKLEEN